MKKRHFITAALASGLVAVISLSTPDKSPQTSYQSTTLPTSQSSESTQIEIPRGAIKRYHFNAGDRILEIDGSKYSVRINSNEIYVEGKVIPELFRVQKESGTLVSYLSPVESEKSLEDSLKSEYGENVKIKFWKSQN